VKIPSLETHRNPGLRRTVALAAMLLSALAALAAPA
jgi:hypothetical protein